MGRAKNVATAALAAAIATLSVAAAPAQDNDAWRKEREGRFASVRASHPPQDGVIADIKAKTAAMVAAAPLFSASAVDRPPVVWQTQTVPVVVFDIPVAPRMVVVPAGEFALGSPSTEPGRRADETRRRIRFDHAVAISMFPVTFGEYAYFSGTTGHKSSTSCAIPEAGRMRARSDADWQDPGFPQTPRSPATCIGFDDATAYATWLSKETGQHYRLLSDAEYEYANRAGTATAYWWGDDRSAGCKLVNGLDDVPACNDGFEFTKPLDTSKANAFGVFDTTGNVASWTSDCWPHSRRQTAGDCSRHVVRGGSWASPATGLRAAARDHAPTSEASADRGFRVARDL